jgi:hypothetical protein
VRPPAVRPHEWPVPKVPLVTAAQLQRRLDDAEQAGYVRGMRDGQQLGPPRPLRTLIAFALGMAITGLLVWMRS